MGITLKPLPNLDNKSKTAEALFHELKIAPELKIKDLWTQQADLIRDYHKGFVDKENLSIELPTGKGKTMVGLLIGEWRRRNLKQKVLYLCPNNQLAYQVGNYAEKIGIKAHVLVGKQKDYSESKFNDYMAGNAIAISNYHSLFNQFTRFTNCETIIFDDAHSGDDPIASLWSLSINHDKYEDLFLNLVDLFKDSLSSQSRYNLRIKTQDSYNKFTMMIPSTDYIKNKNRLFELIDSTIGDDSQIFNDNKLFYPWLRLKEHLDSCNLIISDKEILIKPWVIPTMTHKPFAIAKQRIFMSATLGSSGELERSFGITRIERLRLEEEWADSDAGCRFFVFPDYSFNFTSYYDWLLYRIQSMDRTLIITPDSYSIDSLRNAIQERDNTIEIFGAEDVEQSIEPFIRSKHGVLLLANRYDGIDLPDEACRQLILYNLPKAVNIQEYFLMDKLQIDSVLVHKIITRFIQAAGRCTRGAKDYSLVIVTGQNFLNFCNNNQNRELMPPQLRAELDFCLYTLADQVKEIQDLEDCANVVLEQGDNWNTALNSINERKQLYIKSEVNAQKKYDLLSKIVKDEVNYQYALWNSDYPSAVRFAHQVVDAIYNSKIDGLENYAALWLYFAGQASLEQYHLSKNENDLNNAKQLFIRAKKSAKMVSWYSKLPEIVGAAEEKPEIDYEYIVAIEHILEKLSKFGVLGDKFKKSMDDTRILIMKDEAVPFENGLTELGNLLGFEAYRPNGTGTPDSVWTISDKILLLFEAKTDEKGPGVSIEDCRKTSGHYDWAHSKVEGYDTYPIKKSILISHKTKLNDSAEPYIRDLYYMDANRVREIFEQINEIFSTIRTGNININNTDIQFRIYTELLKNKIDPMNLVREIDNNKLSNMEILKNK